MGDLAMLWARRMIVAVVAAVACGCASKQHSGESPREADRSMVTLAVTWAVLMPALMALSTRLDGYAALAARR